MATTFDISAGKVLLDLTKLNKVLGDSTASLYSDLQEQLSTIRERLSSAHSAAYNGDTHENYICLCNANSQRERMAQTAQKLADAIQARFYVSEACKRETVTTIVTPTE